MIALALFNIGIEIGQIGIVAIVLAAIWGLQKARVHVPEPIVVAPLFLIGGIASFWLIERTLIVAGLS